MFSLIIPLKLSIYPKIAFAKNLANFTYPESGGCSPSPKSVLVQVAV